MDSTQLSARLRDSLRNTPLWDFALEVYARDEVATICLLLQDEAGADVCELLWLCWLDTLGLVAQGSLDDELDPLRRWQAEITQPLRQQRRALKKQVLTNPEITELRDTIKQAELLAEREALRMLQCISEEALGSADWIRPLSEADAALGQRLYAWLPKQKKHHLYALQTLESRLDPSQGAR